MASKVGKRTRKISVKTCVVCCEDEQFYAIGACDHWVCYKCCVRMRVLGKENYCSVCRTDLHQVFLTRKRVPYNELLSRRNSFGYFDKKHGIHYESSAIEEAVKKLLQHRCPICPEHPPEKTFSQLRAHVRKAHEMNYCDLCVKHLRKFTHELKVYTRADLARHRRQGDADDTSYKGHPLCEFCDERYLDDDELHRHLRKTHFWCHFCEREGGQQYYPNYNHLREHFRQAHFLCEEGDCLHEQFTSVFSTKVDFQAHIAVKHANKLSKAEARQARQLDVDLQFAPRGRPGPFRRNQGSRDGADHRPKEQQVKARETKPKVRCEGESVQGASAVTPPESPSPQPSVVLEVPAQPTPLEDFPSIAALSDTAVKDSKRGQENGKQYAKRLDDSKINSEDFPSLPVAPSKTKATPRPPPGFSQAAAKPPGFSQDKKSKNPARERPPGLPSSGEPPGLTNKENNIKENADYPALGQTQEAVADTQARQERNQTLVENIKALLGYDGAKFAEFKRLSGGFRQGSITASSYYEKCFQLFGSKFYQVFFELVDLLPDAAKQKELLCAHQDAKIVAKQEGRTQTSSSNTRKEVPRVWNSAVQSGGSQPQRPAVVTSNRPAKSNKFSFGSEQDFPSLPPASGKRFVQPIYKGNTQSAAVLKEAWVRGK